MRPLTGTPTSAVRVSSRTVSALLAVSTLGIVAFCWPLLITPSAGVEHAGDAPWIFAAVLPMLIAVAAAELSSGGMDAKAVAILGVLAAVGAALRPLGGGATGFQPMFLVVVLGGYVFGPGFGFVLGAVTTFASALITGGVGPWLPFQMLAVAWVGMGAGLLPHVARRAELWVLCAYGVVSGLVFGLLMNLSFWPWATFTGTTISYLPGAAWSENLARFVTFHFATSLGWDLTRALGTVILLLVLGQPALRALRRTARRAAFTAPVVFAPPPASSPPTKVVA